MAFRVHAAVTKPLLNLEFCEVSHHQNRDASQPGHQRNDNKCISVPHNPITTGSVSAAHLFDSGASGVPTDLQNHLGARDLQGFEQCQAGGCLLIASISTQKACEVEVESG